jgi:hypothetical protein
MRAIGSKARSMVSAFWSTAMAINTLASSIATSSPVEVENSEVPGIYYKESSFSLTSSMDRLEDQSFIYEFGGGFRGF